MSVSPTMQAALDMLEQHGALERRPGGFWTFPGCVETRPTVPDWNVAVNTIEALVDRNLAVVSKRAGKAQFAVEVKKP